MLRIYTGRNGHLAPIDTIADAGPAGVFWFDLLNPTADEAKLIEAYLGIGIPTLDEMAEIEPSARLYEEDDAQFMTMTAVANADGDEPVKLPITFIVKGPTLVTVRHADPKPFRLYAAKAQRSGGIAPLSSGEAVMYDLLEMLTDRMADTLEQIGEEADTISREVFMNKSTSASKKTRDLQSLIERIGSKGDLLTKVRESLVSTSRLVAYHSARRSPRAPKEIQQRIKLVQRDAASLGDHAIFLSAKINFLLDATLGLINLEQNQIIKIFSVAAVALLPPTLVASIYGMNFDIMPELHWTFGYPWALGLMAASAIIPYLYFKRRGWL